MFLMLFNEFIISNHDFYTNIETKTPFLTYFCNFKLKFVLYHSEINGYSNCSIIVTMPCVLAEIPWTVDNATPFLLIVYLPYRDDFLF